MTTVRREWGDDSDGPDERIEAAQDAYNDGFEAGYKAGDLAADKIARALWECFLISGADPSDYAHETRTPEGREAGYQMWLQSDTNADVVVGAVQQLRDEYDDDCMLSEHAEGDVERAYAAGREDGYKQGIEDAENR